MRKDIRERRIQQIIGGLVSSQPITPEAVSVLWKVSKQTAENLIREAEERLAQSAAYNRDTEIAKAKRQCEEIYRLAINRSDLRNAIAARNELTRLLSLDTSSETTNRTDEEAVERARAAILSLNIIDAPDTLPIDELVRQLIMYILVHKKNGEL